MKRFLKALFSFALLGCTVKTDKTLPLTRPENFALAFSHGGGMKPEGEGMYFSEKICTFGQWNLKTHTIYAFYLSTKDLDDLYQTLLTNKFAQIKVNKTMAHDAATTSIQVWFDKEFIQKHEGASGDIDSKYQKQWEAILKTCNDLKTKVLGTDISACSIKLQNNVRFKDYDVSISIAMQSIYSARYMPAFTPSECKLNLLVGDYVLELTISDREKPSSKTYKIPLSIKTDTKNVEIIFDENEYKIK